MKSRIIALVALSSLALSPVFAAPGKTSSPTRAKRTSPPSAPAAEEKISAQQAGARKLVAALTTTQKSKMLTLLNEGTAEELADIKGVSKTRAAAIENARPFKTIDQVILVKGIGKGTFSEVVSHARTLTTSRKKSSAPPASSKKKKKA